MLKVYRIINEGGKMRFEALRQRLENAPRPDFVALIRRIGNTVRQKEDFPTRRHARCRASKGPAIFAIGSGSFFQACATRENFGLFGLTLGISRAPIRA